MCLRVSAILQGPGKKWEHTPVNQNGKPQRVAMHVRMGDTVKVRRRQLAVLLSHCWQYLLPPPPLAGAGC